MRRESSFEDDPEILSKLDELKTSADQVSKLSADRLSVLEQAVPLASHLYETHDDLQSWFDEMESVIAEQDLPALNTQQIKNQQDKAKVIICLDLLSMLLVSVVVETRSVSSILR